MQPEGNATLTKYYPTLTSTTVIPLSKLSNVCMFSVTKFVDLYYDSKKVLGVLINVFHL